MGKASEGDEGVEGRFIVTIQWREVFKFLSGAALAGAFATLYLWLAGISVPFLGYMVTPRLLGLKGAVLVALFVVFLYCGWLKE
jgi:hypothetical protein